MAADSVPPLDLGAALATAQATDDPTSIPGRASIQGSTLSKTRPGRVGATPRAARPLSRAPSGTSTPRNTCLTPPAGSLPAWYKTLSQGGVSTTPRHHLHPHSTVTTSPSLKAGVVTPRRNLQQSTAKDNILKLKRDIMQAQANATDTSSVQSTVCSPRLRTPITAFAPRLRVSPRRPGVKPPMPESTVESSSNGLHAASPRKAPSQNSQSSPPDSPSLQSPIPIPITIEVISLSGESLLRDTFMLEDSIEFIKKKIKQRHGYSIFCQELVWQEAALRPGSLLKDVGFPNRRAVLHLMMKTLPDPSEFTQDMREHRSRALAALTPWIGRTKLSQCMRELSSLSRPPHACEAACFAVLHMLAGVDDSVEVNQSGRAADASWKGVQVMLRSATLVQSLREVPNLIDQGKLSSGNLEAAKENLNKVPGSNAEQKIEQMRFRSLAAERLIAWALSIQAYAEAVANICERFHGACMRDLFLDLNFQEL